MRSDDRRVGDILEAARALTPNFRSRHSEIPWTEVIGMRTILVHRYFDIDPEVV
ncbi:MAG: DUF86 domain-containing protein, partial [Gemmatimonadetes bacterium]|nr:DUF86 domain-containing protein [Gemmatimonadota bacterium]